MVVVVGTLTGHLKDEQELSVDEKEEKCLKYGNSICKGWEMSENRAYIED